MAVARQCFGQRVTLRSRQDYVENQSMYTEGLVAMKAFNRSWIFAFAALAVAGPAYAQVPAGLAFQPNPSH